MRIKQFIQRGFWSSILFYCLVEFACFLFIYTQYIPAQYPSFHSVNYSADWLPYIADCNPLWGMWHPANATCLVHQSCFNVSYKTNQFGMRDTNRTQAGDTDRVIVLGDSFMEGHGVEAKERLTNLLESTTHKPFLNFACTGPWGLTQSYLIYHHLAKQFTHDKVLIGIFPLNDFWDDDAAFGKAVYPKRYRPYWVGNYPDYSLQYSLSKLKESEFTIEHQQQYAHSLRNRVCQTLRAYSYWFNAYEYIRYVRPAILKEQRSIATNKNSYSGYYDYTGEQLKRMCFSLQKIKQDAKGKEVYIVTIPTESDCSRYAKEGRSPLEKELNTFCNANDIYYLDLLPLTMEDKQENLKGLFLQCDGHWSVNGNQYYTKKILPFIQQ